MRRQTTEKKTIQFNLMRSLNELEKIRSYDESSVIILRWEFIDVTWLDYQRFFSCWIALETRIEKCCGEYWIVIFLLKSYAILKQIEYETFKNSLNGILDKSEFLIPKTLPLI